MISRLETMVLCGMDLPLSAVRGQIAAGIDVIIHLGRMRDKSRKVLEISEVLGIEEGKVKLNRLFVREEGELKLCDNLFHRGKWEKVFPAQ